MRERVRRGTLILYSRPASQPLRRQLISYAPSPSPSPPTTLNSPMKKHWKIGEYPGFTKTSIPQFSSTNNKKKRSPVNNIKKKLDKKNNAKGWANTVTKALSEAIDKKQWIEAHQVFEMLKAHPFYHLKEGTYINLLVLLSRSGQLGQARQLFDEMLEECLELTPELYTALMAAW